MKNGLEIIPVRWIDQVLETALERLPAPLPDAAAGTTTAPEGLAPADVIVAASRKRSGGARARVGH